MKPFLEKIHKCIGFGVRSGLHSFLISLWLVKAFWVMWYNSCKNKRVIIKSCVWPNENRWRIL